MTESFDHLLEKYATLVIRVGVNVQPGQRVVILCLPEQADVARALATEAYRVGASKVTIDYADPHLQRAEVLHAPEASLGTALPHELEGIRAWRDDRPAVIRLTGNPNPGLMEGLDPARLAKSQPVARAMELLPLLATSHVSWTVVGAPTPGWAESVLGVADTARLWDAVATAMRLDEDDPVRSWRDHLAALALRRDVLNERRFDAVRYRGPGTDLTVGLAPGSRWATASQQNSDGVPFSANLPTEEVFLSPDWRRAEGSVTTTVPFFLSDMGAMVENLHLTFGDGTVTDAVAARGQEAVRQQLDSVPRARHLGEVAIVDSGSRVRRSGLVFKDMLFDENAGSHIAWGTGFPFAVEGAIEMTTQERIDAGLNQSPTHVDIVVGSPEVEIEGLHADGTRVSIVRGDVFELGEE